MNCERHEAKARSLIMDKRSSALKRALMLAGRCSLFLITAIPTLAIVFILFFIVKEALPFFGNFAHVKEFFTSTNWTPSRESDPGFGALSIFYGTAMVTIGSCAIAVPLGISVAVCLSEIVSGRAAQIFKPLMELLAAIPSVAYGFFALVVFAPVLQNHGGALMSAMALAVGVPAALLLSIPSSKWIAGKFAKNAPKPVAAALRAAITALALSLPALLALRLLNVEINSGTNALNVSIILAIMAVPTIVSISQDAISAVGRDMREGSLALGGTRFETIFKVVLPCAKSGIAVAVILGLMRVVGETMVVWMASGNSLKIPEPFYNFFEPVRTLTATIAGEMGEADQSTGSSRYHVLFAMSLCLLLTGLLMNAASQWIGSGMKVKGKRWK